MRSRFLAAAMLLLASALPARATILFAGGEPVDFTCNVGGTCLGTVTTAGHFRSDWAREAAALAGSAGTHVYDTKTFAATTDVWMHGQFFQTGGNLTASGFGYGALLVSFGSLAQVTIQGTGTAGQVKLVKVNDAGANTTLVTCAAATFPTSATLTQFDLHVNYAVAGEASLYINGAGTPYCTYSGDVTSNGYTTLSSGVISCGSGNGGQNCSWSEVIIANANTRGMGLKSLTTNANGAVTGWTGANVCTAIWAATAYSDASFGAAASNNLTHQCGVTDTLPAGVFSALAVGMSFRGLIGAAGPQHVKFVTRLGGVDYLSADFTPTTSMSNCCMSIQATNPATAVPWVTGDIAGIQLGLKSTP